MLFYFYSKRIFDILNVQHIYILYISDITVIVHLDANNEWMVIYLTTMLMSDLNVFYITCITVLGDCLRSAVGNCLWGFFYVLFFTVSFLKYFLICHLNSSVTHSLFILACSQSSVVHDWLQLQFKDEHIEFHLFIFFSFRGRGYPSISGAFQQSQAIALSSILTFIAFCSAVKKNCSSVSLSLRCYDELSIRITLQMQMNKCQILLDMDFIIECTISTMEDLNIKLNENNLQNTHTHIWI